MCDATTYKTYIFAGDRELAIKKFYSLTICTVQQVSLYTHKI